MYKLGFEEAEEPETTLLTLSGSWRLQTGFRKGRGTRDQIVNICWIIEKAREFQKTSISALLTMSKPIVSHDVLCIEVK